MKNDEYLKQNNLKPLFYYIGRHSITVCLLLKGDTVMVRGVAICSVSDQFEKKIGRAKALGRAVQSYIRSGNIGEINPDRFFVNDPLKYANFGRVAHAKFLFKYKAIGAPILHENEIALVKRYKGNKELPR